MSRNLNELNPAEWAHFVDQLKEMTPAHTNWTGTAGNYLATWSTPSGVWLIEVNKTTTRTVIRQGTENKWTNFAADPIWHRDLLDHFGALD